MSACLLSHSGGAGLQEADICATFEVASLEAAMRREDAVPHLHAKLRDCVDMMGVGGAAPRADTVAEDTAAIARTAIDGKDMGDVKCGPFPGFGLYSKPVRLAPSRTYLLKCEWM